MSKPKKKGPQCQGLYDHTVQGSPPVSGSWNAPNPQVNHTGHCGGQKIQGGRINSQTSQGGNQLQNPFSERARTNIANQVERQPLGHTGVQQGHFSGAPANPPVYDAAQGLVCLPIMPARLRHSQGLIHAPVWDSPMQALEQQQPSTMPAIAPMLQHSHTVVTITTSSTQTPFNTVCCKMPKLLGIECSRALVIPSAATLRMSLWRRILLK